MPRAWRIVKARHAADAFNGEGSRRYGGRWNSVGTRLVYTSQSVALATLEILIHLHEASALAHYVVFEMQFAEHLVERITEEELPYDWSEDPIPAAAQRIGDEWVATGRSAVLEVPSAVVKTEKNFLLNPAHPDFRRITRSKARPYRIDPRLPKAT